MAGSTLFPVLGKMVILIIFLSVANKKSAYFLYGFCNFIGHFLVNTLIYQYFTCQRFHYFTVTIHIQYTSMEYYINSHNSSYFTLYVRDIISIQHNIKCYVVMFCYFSFRAINFLRTVQCTYSILYEFHLKTLQATFWCART